MPDAPRSLRTELLVDLGFVTSAAVVLVSLTTLLLAGGDLRDTYPSLLVLWFGSTAVFLCFGSYVLRRSVLAPLRRLTAEADALAAGDVPPVTSNYGSAELDRLAQRYRTTAEALTDVQTHIVRVEKLAGIGRLAAGVAHEVRNPLGAVGTFVEVLERRGTDPAITAGMREAIARIERIVQGLVDYARPGAGGVSATGTTELNAAITTVHDFLAAQGMFREHSVSVVLDPGSPKVRGDRHLLEQVVLNLVANACQATPMGRVTIGTMTQPYAPGADRTLRRDDAADAPYSGERSWSPRPRRRDLPVGTSGVLLYVADDGPGVPEADRERIFDPFFTSKEPGAGTGLGLAIVARTVHESGGMVWVERAREGGAVFRVFLPTAEEADASPDR